jgi:hypothetical protein
LLEDASTFCITGMRGADTRVAASTAENFVAAPAISAQCDGTLTASLMARFAPAAVQRSIAASTAVAAPAITI